MWKALKFFCLILTLPLAAVEQPAVEPVIILGGGVGSLTSALYLGRAGVSPVVIEGPNPGGLLTQSHTVQNWPGEMEIDGTELTDRMRKQAEASGARFIQEEVVAVDFSKRPFTITTKVLGSGPTTHRLYRAESCIIAMGTKPNFLEIPGEQTYWGRGVTNCAICDGSLYKDRVVGVVGGGDAAILEALYLSNIAREVHVFVRKGAFRAIDDKRIAALKKKKNVKFHFSTTVDQVLGDGESVTGVSLTTRGQAQELALDGLFLAIGSTPNTAIFQKALKLDDKGYVLLEKDQQTSVKGIYAIGDIVDPVYKQAISAAGDGAKAALQAQQYLSDRANHLIGLRQPPEKIASAVSASSEVTEISSDEQFRQEVSQSKIPLVVDFYAPWCGPCKQVTPVIESAAAELEGKYRFLKVNVDHLHRLSEEYEIRGMPTVVLLEPGGKEVERAAGFKPISQLLQNLK